MRDPKPFVPLLKLYKMSCWSPKVFTRIMKKDFAAPEACESTGMCWVVPLDAVPRRSPVDYKPA